MTLEQWGALAAIFTFLGGITLAAEQFGLIYLRRWRVERNLINWRRERSTQAADLCRRFVGQIAIDLGLTPDQVYEAASRSKKLNRGSNGAGPDQIWFAAKDEIALKSEKLN